MRLIPSFFCFLFITLIQLDAFQDNQAINEFDAMVLEKRKNFAQFRQKAADQIGQGKFFSALLHLNNAEAIFTKDAHLHFLKGLCFANIHCYTDAVLAYKKARTINPNHLPTLINLVEIHFYLKDYKNTIFWQNKTQVVLGRNTSPLLNFKYYIAVCKLTGKSKKHQALKAKIVANYTQMDDNPFYYYASAIKYFDEGNKEAFFAQIHSATYIFNDVPKIQKWNKALEDAGYLTPSDIVVREVKSKYSQPSF